MSRSKPSRPLPSRLKTLRRLSSLALLTASLGLANAANASTAIEYPDNGVAQMSRGGAWLVSASDPLAAYFNPAALATQSTSLGLGINFPMQKICFQRQDEDGSPAYPDPSQRGNADPYPEVCNEHSGFPRFIPNVAFNWRVSERLAIGLAVAPPSSYGKLEWPLFVKTTNRVPVVAERDIPAPQRYLSTLVEGTILMPTLSFGYALSDEVRVGAGFVSGLAILNLNAVSMSTVAATRSYDEFGNDNLSELSVKDLFVPGVVASIHASLSPNLEISGWFKAIDSIRAKGDASITAYLNRNGAPTRVCSAEEVRGAIAITPEGQTPDLSCSVTTHSEDEVGADKVTLKMAVPMEARIGVRYRKPASAPSLLEREQFREDSYSVRDPLRDELYDIELNFTWANNSAGDTIEVRFLETFQPIGLPGLVPQNADRPTGFRDSLGARLGGQYNVIRNRLGLRAGSWVETSAIRKEYLNVTGAPGLRGGFGGGFVSRFNAFDIEAGYQYVWNEGIDNEGKGAMKAIAGSGNSPENRSYHSVNGGKLTQHAHVVAIGGVVRF